MIEKRGYIEIRRIFILIAILSDTRFKICIGLYCWGKIPTIYSKSIHLSVCSRLFSKTSPIFVDNVINKKLRHWIELHSSPKKPSGFASKDSVLVLERPIVGKHVI